MTERLDPIRPYGDRRQFRRRGEDQAAAAPETPQGGTNLPVPAPAGPHARERHSPPPLDGQAAFSAQLLGQPGVRRGLRGGSEVIDAARSAYLETEYSGPSDRRPSKGLLKKTEI
ncbi:MAG: hypothetical protein GC145_10410 [Caulobacter sp.]|nr:hypothetical protein [Caulobacter sp.]